MPVHPADYGASHPRRLLFCAMVGSDGHRPRATASLQLVMLLAVVAMALLPGAAADGRFIVRLSEDPAAVRLAQGASQRSAATAAAAVATQQTNLLRSLASARVAAKVEYQYSQVKCCCGPLMVRLCLEILRLAVYPPPLRPCHCTAIRSSRLHIMLQLHLLRPHSMDMHACSHTTVCFHTPVRASVYSCRYSMGCLLP